MRLDVFLASQMRRSEDLVSRLAQSGVGLEQLGVAEREAKIHGILQPRVPAEVFIGTFGPPEQFARDELRYQLALWPEHTFVIGIRSLGLITYNGFELNEPSRFPIYAHGSFDAESLGLSIGVHTSAIVRNLLGEPDVIEGWERLEDWTYRLRDSNRRLVLGFDYELLSEILWD